MSASMSHNKAKKVIAAAIQLDTEIGNTQHNLGASERLANEALTAGASWIALPEFFNTGVCWNPDLVKAIEYENGPSATFLRDFSSKNSVVIGGSFMCRVPEGGVRNRYLCFDNGKLVGKHDKDLPTMWENAFYEGGDPSDTGVLGSIDGVRVGSAMCWEFLRTQTARRLRGKVDVIMGGSHWWSMPKNWPKYLLEKSEEYNYQAHFQ
jgi:predicted amidohydrolase